MEHLIPTTWFTGAPQWGLLLTSAIAIALLGKGADWLVDGASGLAYRMGISKVIVGATIVSLGTTSPEAAVSVVAAWSGQPGLALGNAIGSIIADSGLIFGLRPLRPGTAGVGAIRLGDAAGARLLRRLVDVGR
jgi:cation:H+ antiporter